MQEEVDVELLLALLINQIVLAAFGLHLLPKRLHPMLETRALFTLKINFDFHVTMVSCREIDLLLQQPFWGYRQCQIL